ncbi:hypothetical protein CWB66_20995 [Pseudoalteromonas sp. S558]|nr:hypothetical protein CWB66_20995 [Pseudoalteromonas sp. S558]
MYFSDGILNIFFTFFWLLSLFWTFIPNGVGLYKFKLNHNKFWCSICTIFWYMLFVVHIAAFYLIWFQSFSKLVIVVFIVFLQVMFWTLVVKKAVPT